MRTRLCFSLVTILALAFLGLTLASHRSGLAAEDAKKESAAGYNLVAPLSAIMEVMEDNVFKQIPVQLKAGKLKDIKREGLFLAEIANLTAQEKDHRGKKEWTDFCDQFKAASLKLSETAEKKDEAGVKAQHAAMEKVCDACHEKFRDN